MTVKEQINASRDAITESLAALVKIKSVEAAGEGGYPFGVGVHECLETALALGASLGLATGRMDEMAGWCEWGEGEEMIAVLGHLDVVPEGDGWSYLPYGAQIAKGRIYGRGTMDDKGPTVAALYALAALKACGVPLKRRVRVLLGTNEETGSAGMKYYVKHGGELPVMAFTPDGEYPVINGEKGIVNLSFRTAYTQTGSLRLLRLSGGTAANVVPAFAEAELACSAALAAQLQKASSEALTVAPTARGVRMTATGVSAHASNPEQGENAIGRLLLALAALPFLGEVKDAVRFLAGKIGMESNGKALGIAASDEPSGPLTLNLGVISADESALSVRMNLRYPVTCRYEQSVPALQQIFEAAGFDETELVHKPGFYKPPESELIAKLCAVYTRETGLAAKPKCIGGGTYAKVIPNTVAFGPVFPGDEVREHKPDEFIELDRLIQNTHMIAAAMIALAN